MRSQTSPRSSRPEPRWKRGHFVSSDNSAAAGGYDPVAYFSQAKAVAGKPEITAVWSDTTWRFSTPENRNLFMASPEKYAPRLGGHCGFAVSFSSNPKAPPAPPGLPHRWSIVDGKLYLNANLFAHIMFRVFNRAARAEQVWQALSA